MNNAIQYHLSINQPLTIEYNLTLSRACVFDYLVKGISWTTDTMKVDGKLFFYLSRVKAAKDLPIITDKPDTMYRHYKALAKSGLIEHHLEPVFDSNKSILYMKDYIRIPPEIAKRYFQKSKDAEQNTPSDFDDKTPTDNDNDPYRHENPTNYNTSIDYNTNPNTTNAGASADLFPSFDSDNLKEVIVYLNQKAGRGFKSEGKAGRSNRDMVAKWLNKGYTVAELKAMIDYKAAEWKDSTYWRRYLRPETLFGSKAATYIEESKTLTPIKAQKNGKYREGKNSQNNALARSESEYSESGGLFRPKRRT